MDAAALFVPTLIIELTPFNGSIVVNCEQATAAWIPRTVVDREAAVVRARSEFSMISDCGGKGSLFPRDFARKLCQAFARKTSYCGRLLPDQRKRERASARLGVNRSKVPPYSHVCMFNEHPGSIADRSSPPSRMGGPRLSRRGCRRIRNGRQSVRLGCGGDADRICAGSTLALFSHENAPSGMGRIDSRAPGSVSDRCPALAQNQICAAVSCDRSNRDLVHSTTGEAGMSLSRIPLTKLLECSVPNSRAISIDSSMTTAAGVPIRVIS